MNRASYLKLRQSIWANLAKTNPQQSQMGQHITERNSDFKNKYLLLNVFLDNMSIYLFFISWPTLSRQLLCSNFEKQNDRAVELLTSNSVLTVSPSKIIPLHPRAPNTAVYTWRYMLKNG
jgi:hypothetical protein